MGGSLLGGSYTILSNSFKSFSMPREGEREEKYT